MRERGWGVMWGCGGGILLFSPRVWAGSGGRGGTHTHTHTHTHTGTRTGTYTRMLHLPFSDLPFKKCPIPSYHVVFGPQPFCELPLVSSVGNPLSPYSIQERPKPQICPKFVQRLFLRAVRGTEICQNLSEFAKL